MVLRKSKRLPLWMLNLVAASSLAAPAAGWTQTTPSPRPATAAKRPVSPRQPSGQETASPKIVLTQAQVPETDVQRELRRLYEESGREMPEVPTTIQTQRPQPAAGRTATQPPVAPPPQMTPITPNSPGAPAGPQPSSGNRVTSFFKRLLPGGQSRPTTAQQTPPPAHPVMPPGPQTAMPPTQSQPPAQKAPANYAPYAGQQPRRLPAAGQPASTPSTTAAAAAPSAPALPPSPAQLPVTAAPVIAAPVTAAPVSPPKPAAAPVQQTPASAPQVASRSAGPLSAPEPQAAADDLNFEPPVIVSAPATEFDARIENRANAPHPLEALISEPVESAPEALVASTPATEFPDPFPEMSEEEADDLDESEFESPFLGLKLDEDPYPAEAAAEAAPEIAAETAPETDPLPPLTTGPDAGPALAAETTAPASLDQSAGPELSAPETLPSLTLPATETPAVPQARIVETSSADQYAEKMRQVRERGGMKGLKGFCPVTLRDERELKDSQPEFQSSHRGQKFHFATAEAKAKFDQDPARYAPAAYGADVVVLIRDKDVAEGSLDFAAWYKGNLYLFSSEETYSAFISEPVKYASPAGLE